MPGTTAVLDLKVSVLDVVVLAELRVALMPVGRPVTESATLPVRLTGLVTVIVLLALAVPTRRVRLLGEAASPKPGAGTVNVMVVLLDRFPELPVTVTG